MPELKAGIDVMIHGKIKEIIITEKETIYRVKIHEAGKEINSFIDEVLIRPQDIVE